MCVISHSGYFNSLVGAETLFDTIMKDCSLFLLLQPVNLDSLTELLIRGSRAGDRIYIEPSRLGWREAWASMGGVDVGVVIYKNQAPQFQNMGTSSNKLCMYLAMGVPVVALRQQSFEFIEKYECGVLFDNEGEFFDAIQHVRDRLGEMRENALICAREYIAAPQRYEDLKKKISELVD